MKKLAKLTFSVVMAVLILAMSALTASADSAAKINGETVNVGDTVTYTLYISDSVQNIVGIDARFFFDDDALELTNVDTNSLGDATVVNDNASGDGVISLNNAYVKGGKGLECEDKTLLVSLTFNVINAKESEITYYIPYLYDFDMVNLYSYTFTYDLEIDGDTVIEEETPILAGNDELNKIDSLGDFVNNADGKGDGVPVLTEVIEPETEVREETTVPEETEETEDKKNDQDRDKSEDGGKDENKEDDPQIPWFMIILIAVISICVVAAIVIIVLMLRKPGKK